MNSDYAHIRSFCRTYRAQVVFQRLLYTGATLAAIILALLSLVQICFAAFPWTALPLVWDAFVLAGLIGFTARCIDRIALRPLRIHDVAAMIEERLSMTHPWVSLAIEIASQKTQASSDLGSLVQETARRSIENCPHSPAWRTSWTNAILLLLSIVFFTTTTVFLEPSCAGFWKLPLSFLKPVHAIVTPGNIIVAKGTSCRLSCAVGFSSFPSCRLSIASTDGLSYTRLIGKDSSGTFSHILVKVGATTVYQFAIGNTTLPPDTIRVVGKPTLAALSVRLIPPAYTELRPSTLPEGQGNFAAYPGTKAQIHVVAPFSLSRSRFVSSTGDTIACAVSGREASCIVTVDRRKTYSFALVDTFGQASDSMPLFSMETIPDMPPIVSFVKPGANKACSQAMAETLVVEAVDDVGLGGLTVSMRKNRDTSFVYYSTTLTSRDTARKIVQAFLNVNLKKFSLYPGDSLFYWAIACDNRSYGEPQCAATDTFFFRVPSFEEIHAQIARERNATEQTVQTVRKKQDDMLKTASSLLQSTKSKQSPSWEQQQIAKDLNEAIKTQADSLQKAVESFKEAVDKLKQEQSVPPQLLEKMDQVQKELENLRKQYGDSLLFKMPDRADNVSMNDLRQSLEKLKDMLPELSQRLDNTLKFLAMLKRDQALAKLAAQAQRLAQDQQDIADAAQSPEQCLAKQEKECNGVDSLMRDIDQGASPSGDSSLLSKNDLPSLSQIKLLQDSMRSDLRRRSAPQRAAMDRMSGSLMSLSQDLQNLQSSALAKKMDQEREALLSMAHDALSLSSWQRQLGDRAPSDASDAAADQQALRQSLLQSSTKLDRLAMTPPPAVMAIKKGYDDAAAAMDRAVSFLSMRYGSFTSEEPQATIDILAKTILDALADMNNQPQSAGGGAAGMMQALRRLSGKQSMLNALTGGLLKRMLGSNGEGEEPQAGSSRQAGGASQSAEDEKARRQAQAAQRQIAEELKKLSEKYGRDAGSSLDKRTKDLAEEAERLARQFDNPSRDLPDRQDRFLSRMLETTLSQHRQDEGKEDRISQSAKTVYGPESGASAGTDFGPDAFYRIRQRAFSGNFPESYRFSVRNYFDSLGVLYLKGK